MVGIGLLWWRCLYCIVGVVAVLMLDLWCCFRYRGCVFVDDENVFVLGGIVVLVVVILSLIILLLFFLFLFFWVNCVVLIMRFLLLM